MRRPSSPRSGTTQKSQFKRHDRIGATAEMSAVSTMLTSGANFTRSAFRSSRLLKKALIDLDWGRTTAF